MRFGALASLALAAAIAGVGCSAVRDGNLAVSGQIEATDVDAGSKVGGRVAEVLVELGDRVSKGDVLVRLESNELDAQLKMAQAKLAQAEAQFEKISAGPRAEEIKRAKAALNQYEEQYQMALKGARDQEINAAREQVKAAQAQFENAQSELERARALYEKNVLPERQYEAALHAKDGAQAQLQAARQKLDALVEGTRSEEIAMAKAGRDQAAAVLEELQAGARKEDLETARAMREEARAAVGMAQSQLDEMTVVAPMDGVVESIDVEPGDLVKPGALVRITDPEDLELKVYVSAWALGHIGLGDQVVITTDSHGDEQFEGEVIFIASKGEFTPRNLQTEEERVQQVFGVKLRLHPVEDKLKAGMAATAHFDLGGGEGA